MSVESKDDFSLISDFMKRQSCIPSLSTIAFALSRYPSQLLSMPIQGEQPSLEATIV